MKHIIDCFAAAFFLASICGANAAKAEDAPAIDNASEKLEFCQRFQTMGDQMGCEEYRAFQSVGTNVKVAQLLSRLTPSKQETVRKIENDENVHMLCKMAAERFLFDVFPAYRQIIENGAAAGTWEIPALEGFNVLLKRASNADALCEEAQSKIFLETNDPDLAPLARIHEEGAKVMRLISNIIP